jgi:hypothetical protein
MPASTVDRLLSPISAALVLSIFAGSAAAQCIDPQKLVPTGTIAADAVGTAVRLSGNSMLVGAPGADLPGKTDAGAVYAYYWASNIQNQFSWDQYAKLTATDSAASAAFGKTVAFSDPWAAVQAPGMAGGGAVYFFARNGNTWQQMQKITAPTSSEEFGASLDMDGEWAIVGSPSHDHGAASPNVNYGAARVYKRSSTTWTQHVYLARSSVLRQIDERFGEAVAIRGTLAVVGAPNYRDILTQNVQGAASAYMRTGESWASISGAYLAPDGGDGDRYGAAVATDGQWVFVGAPGHGPTDVGAVYIFKLNGSALQFRQKIVPVSATGNGQFGSELSVSGGKLAVAAAGSKIVTVFILANDTWHHEFRLSDPDSPASGSFASSVSISAQHVAVGDVLDDNGAVINSGAAYGYRMTASGADTCAAAPLVTQGVYTGCTSKATLDGNAGCYGLSTSPDVWHKYTAPCTGSVMLNTFGSSYNTVLSVHTACPGTISNAIACNDDWSVFEQNAQLSFNATAGETYYIRIGGSSGGRGGYVLNVGACTPAACPANCDGSTAAPILNVDDFTCFINRFAIAQGLPYGQQVTHYANCDQSTTAPVLNVDDFTCFINRYAMGCP